jgi:Icc-related predicted phosphoesterase
MKLAILSDIHNEFTVLPAPAVNADVVILAGDIDVKLRAVEWARQFDKPVLYLIGNHEFYGNELQSIRQKTRQLCQDSNVHLLDDDELILDGVRFVGGTLWTDFKLLGEARQKAAMRDALLTMNDYQVIRFGSAYRRLFPEDTLDLHKQTVGFLTQKLNQPFDGKTMVITHHAPSIKSIHLQYLEDNCTPAFASNLEHLMSDKVALWVHGHVHHSVDYEVNGTRVLSNPRGYQRQGQILPDNTAFDPFFVVEI